MAILGTKKFWKPTSGTSSTQRENQITKNSGYINLQLRTVNYMSVGNFWQSIFKGKDAIALATTLKYQTGISTIEATSVQDLRNVKAGTINNLGLQRNIAVKIPANADAISIEVKMTAVKSDSLQTKFEMLNQPEYQSALQLAPIVVGQVLTITSLVKKLFTDSDPQAQLEASYAGIISAQPEDNPVNNGKLTKGLLIMISTNDGDQFNGADETKFELRGDSLYHNGKQVENTYIVFNISFDEVKGEDENASWFKKYKEALRKLDELYDDPKSADNIRTQARKALIEGNALIDEDSTYIYNEKLQIKSAARSTTEDKYDSIMKPKSTSSLLNAAEIVKDITGSNSFETIEAALPATASFLNAHFDIDPAKPLNDSLLRSQKINMRSSIESDIDINEMLKKDKNAYLEILKKNNLTYKLGAK